MLPDRNERLVLNIGGPPEVIRNDDARRAGVSIGATGTLALAAANVAVVIDMDVADWAALAEVAWAVSLALAAREAELAPIARLATAEAMGHG